MFPKLCWPFTVWINCSSDPKLFANSWPSALNFKSFSGSQTQFFLKVGQNNFGNKIPLNSSIFPDVSFHSKHKYYQVHQCNFFSSELAFDPSILSKYVCVLINSLYAQSFYLIKSCGGFFFLKSEFLAGRGRLSSLDFTNFFYFFLLFWVAFSLH